MVAFNPIVSILFVDVPDVIKVRIISAINLSDDFAVSRGLVRTD